MQMFALLRSRPIECALMGFYIALLVKSLFVRERADALYWLGAAILMSGVMMRMR